MCIAVFTPVGLSDFPSSTAILDKKGWGGGSGEEEEVVGMEEVLRGHPDMLASQTDSEAYRQQDMGREGERGRYRQRETERCVL